MELEPELHQASYWNMRNPTTRENPGDSISRHMEAMVPKDLFGSASKPEELKVLERILTNRGAKRHREPSIKFLHCPLSAMHMLSPEPELYV